MREFDREATPNIQPPMLDLITERDIEPEDRFVDTGFNLDVGVITHLTGRKYVKLQTVKELAQALGYRLVRDKAMDNRI